MLKLTAYSQNNPLWAGEIYAGDTTFSRAGCLVCCVAMIVSLVCTGDITPPEVAYHLRQAGAFEGALLSHPDRIPVAFNWLQWAGVTHYRNGPADMDAIAAEVAQYGATIAELKWDPRGTEPQTGNQHFAVITAVSEDHQDATIIDPWDGASKLLSTTRYRLSGWNAARTIYGIRRVRPIV